MFLPRDPEPTSLGRDLHCSLPTVPGKIAAPGQEAWQPGPGCASGRVNSKRCCVLAPQVGEGDCGEETLEEQPILFELAYV